MELRRFDVVVAGAGAAGSVAAWHLSRIGMRVALIERRTLASAGTRCVHGIPLWMFDRAGIDRPDQRELIGVDAGAFVALSPRNETRVVVSPNPARSVDLRWLIERLQTGALGRGAIPFERARLLGLSLRAGRPRSLAIALADPTGRQRRLELRADLFVDATGLAAALLCQVPELARRCPQVEARDLCFARQEVCEISDRGGASSFLESIGRSTEEGLFWSGVQGGFSTLALTLDRELNTVEVLGGAADGRPGSGEALLRRLKVEHPWIGRTVFGDGAPIPIRAPYPQLVAPGIALLGNAACQVFPAHGSGVGAMMIAARLLAEALEGASDPGALETLWRYQVDFYRERGAIHLAYDRFRRTAQTISGEQLDALYRCGMLTEGSTRSAIAQEMTEISVAEILRLVAGAARDPRSAAQLAAAVAPMAAAYLAGKSIPHSPSPSRRLRRWAALTGALAGAGHDLPF